MQTQYAQPESALQTKNPLAPLAPKPVGAGALSLGTASALGLAIVVGGGIGGGLVGAKLGSKHKTGATIAGTLLGAFVLPMIVGPIIGAVAGGVSGVNAPAAPPQTGG